RILNTPQVPICVLSSKGHPTHWSFGLRPGFKHSSQNVLELVNPGLLKVKHFPHCTTRERISPLRSGTEHNGSLVAWLYNCPQCATQDTTVPAYSGTDYESMTGIEPRGALLTRNE
uniref:Uncharacterized protein n=1 Tax=Callorhinchus milii TaxID=7868 RepID=A0A4W3H294_CALMI